MQFLSLFHSTEKLFEVYLPEIVYYNMNKIYLITYVVFFYCALLREIYTLKAHWVTRGTNWKSRSRSHEKKIEH